VTATPTLIAVAAAPYGTAICSTCSSLPTTRPMGTISTSVCLQLCHGRRCTTFKWPQENNRLDIKSSTALVLVVSAIVSGVGTASLDAQENAEDHETRASITEWSPHG
jgi:hypothetical protein